MVSFQEPLCTLLFRFLFALRAAFCENSPSLSSPLFPGLFSTTCDYTTLPMASSSAAPAGKVRIGISGWTYKPWRGVFYPKEVKQKNELHYASRILNSIEINGTFYSLQRPASFEKWAEETPDDFVFSVKAPRFITHIRRLKDANAPLANFLASGLFRLGAKLGPILWQLPPNYHLATGGSRRLFHAAAAATPKRPPALLANTMIGSPAAPH